MRIYIKNKNNFGDFLILIFVIIFLILSIILSIVYGIDALIAITALLTICFLRNNCRYAYHFGNLWHGYSYKKYIRDKI